MIEINKTVQSHLFICTRQKCPDKECCFDKGGATLVKELKAFVKNQGWKEFIKVSESSCLGHCSTGITACLYPQNQWFHQVSMEDLESLKSMLKKIAENSSHLPNS